MSLGRRNILKVTVKNTGRRAAFVKAVCYAGMVLKCRQDKNFFFVFFGMNCNHIRKNILRKTTSSELKI